MVSQLTDTEGNVFAIWQTDAYAAAARAGVSEEAGRQGR
jgi:hypothetical protein